MKILMKKIKNMNFNNQNLVNLKFLLQHVYQNLKIMILLIYLNGKFKSQINNEIKIMILILKK